MHAIIIELGRKICIQHEGRTEKPLNEQQQQKVNKNLFFSHVV